ncbi:hypothetical protein [Streptomyces sp. NBC_01235]|uniref:hypothetical protein n=1 Tax=Streptomyces sp. NBC_01235 TaxID=2903788 RepID=UPI002E1470D7|nr:hypothetical protein OG289_48920 [Streptomyces sp. NBC_01235]
MAVVISNGGYSAAFVAAAVFPLIAAFVIPTRAERRTTAPAPDRPEPAPVTR